MHQYSPSRTAPIASAYMLLGVSEHRKNLLKYPQDLPKQLGKLLRKKFFLTKIPSENRYFQIRAIKKNHLSTWTPKVRYKNFSKSILEKSNV